MPGRRLFVRYSIVARRRLGAFGGRRDLPVKSAFTSACRITCKHRRRRTSLSAALSSGATTGLLALYFLKRTNQN